MVELVLVSVSGRNHPDERSMESALRTLRDWVQFLVKGTYPRHFTYAIYADQLGWLKRGECR